MNVSRLLRTFGASFILLIFSFVPSFGQQGWKVDISAQNSTISESLNFGIDPNATDGYDTDLDVKTEFPPLPVSGVLYLNAFFAGSNMMVFSTDIRQNGPWRLLLMTNNEYTLSWDVASVPSDVPLFLTPGDGSATINMKEQNSHDFAAGNYEMTISADITPPTPVTDFITTNITNSTIGLTWTNPSEDFAGTVIVRSQGPITWSPTNGSIYGVDTVVASGVIVRYIGAGDYSTTPFIDTGLEPNTTYHYQAFAYDTSHNYSSGVGLSDTSLPVELSSFTAKLTKNGVLLEWRTESEIENTGFNLYRGKEKDGDFVKVNDNLIKGAGITATPQEYRYTDEEVDGSTLFYIIENVAFDGKTNRSDAIKVTSLNPRKKITTLWGRLKTAD